MLVFATSDKGGTGRSVTSANVVYRRALQGSDVAYLDFDFGSPTAGAIFQIESVTRGSMIGGLHSYLLGEASQPHRLDVWSQSDREGLRGQPDGAGKLAFLPGDRDGGEFPSTELSIRRCIALLLRMEEEFDITLIDLSAGRSQATDMVLAATGSPELANVKARWLVFHRWTRQHIVAAQGLVEGERGLLEMSKDREHDPYAVKRNIRYVSTAVVDPDSDELAGLRPEQMAWLREWNVELQRLASSYGIGRATMLGSVPLDPVLQWREQLLTDFDTITRRIANQATVDAFELLATRLDDEDAWVGL